MGKSSPLVTDCTVVRTKLSAFEDGEVSPAWRSEIEAHLANCSACQQAITDLRRLWLDLEDGIPPRPRSNFTQAVMAKITEESGPGFLNWMHVFSSMFPAPATMAVMVVFGLFIGGWMGRTVMEDTLISATSQEQAATLAAMDVFAPTPRGSLAEGYLVLVSLAPQVKQ
jgi:anti-sigma factor RsiW